MRMPTPLPAGALHALVEEQKEHIVLIDLFNAMQAHVSDGGGGCGHSNGVGGGFNFGDDDAGGFGFGQAPALFRPTEGFGAATPAGGGFGFGGFGATGGSDESGIAPSSGSFSFGQAPAPMSFNPRSTIDQASLSALPSSSDVGNLDEL